MTMALGEIVRGPALEHPEIVRGYIFRFNRKRKFAVFVGQETLNDPVKRAELSHKLWSLRGELRRFRAYSTTRLQIRT